MTTVCSKGGISQRTHDHERGAAAIWADRDDGCTTGEVVVCRIAWLERNIYGGRGEDTEEHVRFEFRREHDGGSETQQAKHTRRATDAYAHALSSPTTDTILVAWLFYAAVAEHP